MAHTAQEIDILRTVKSSAAAALHRTDLRKPAFPESQHVLRHVDLVRDFADRAKRFRRLVQRPVPVARRWKFRTLRLAFLLGVDPLLEDGGWLEHHNATRRDRYFFPSLGVAPNALPLLTHDEGAER